MSVLIKGYVEREQALDVINLADFIADERGVLLYADSVQACLLDIPAADVRENIRGEWIIQRGNYNEEFECSECQHISKDGGNYCGNCGARMRRP